MENMRLQCLGAGREVGRSCFILETDQRVMLDCGLKIYNEGMERDMFPMQYQGSLDAIIIGHAHFDHSGYLPSIFAHAQPDWFSTPPTAEITNLLWMDSMKIMGDRSPYTEAEIAKANRKWVGLEYGKMLHLGKTAFRLHDAGHILGAAMVEAEYGGKRFVYTGDFKMEESRMHAGAKPIRDVDVLLIESTYSDREHPERKELEKKLAGDVMEIIDGGGNALFPAFAVGRTQELISIIRAHNKGVPIFVDGMGKEVTRMCLKNPGYVRDAEEFGEHADSAILVGSREDRRDATSMPSVIISTAGMLQGGPALGYMLNLMPGSKMYFTGYNVEGTNGRRMMDENRIILDGNLLDVDTPWEYYDFSAHAGRADLLEFIKGAEPGKIVLNHGDGIPAFAEELRGQGYEVHAPENGETIGL